MQADKLVTVASECGPISALILLDFESQLDEIRNYLGVSRTQTEAGMMLVKTKAPTSQEKEIPKE